MENPENKENNLDNELEDTENSETSIVNEEFNDFLEWILDTELDFDIESSNLSDELESFLQNNKENINDKDAFNLLSDMLSDLRRLDEDASNDLDLLYNEIQEDLWSLESELK